MGRVRIGRGVGALGKGAVKVGPDNAVWVICRGDPVTTYHRDYKMKMRLSESKKFRLGKCGVCRITWVSFTDGMTG